MTHQPIQINFRDRRAWLATYKANTNQKIIQQVTILEELKTNFPLIFERLKDINYNFTTIFIGAASGGIEIPLIQEFLKIRSVDENLEFFAQDISHLMREDFYSYADSFALTELIKAYDLYRFEDSRYQPPQADFALASHSWCYISGWRHEPTSNNSLLKFANLLKPSSVGLINLHSKYSDRCTILSNYLAIDGTFSEICAEDIIFELDNLGIPHRVDIIESSSDISSCFAEGIFNPSIDGKMLLSFWLRTWWDDIPPKSQKQIIEDLNYLVNKNGKEELILRDAYVWITAD